MPTPITMTFRTFHQLTRDNDHQPVPADSTCEGPQRNSLVHPPHMKHGILRRLALGRGGKVDDLLADPSLHRAVLHVWKPSILGKYPFHASTCTSNPPTLPNTL